MKYVYFLILIFFIQNISSQITLSNNVGNNVINNNMFSCYQTEWWGRTFVLNDFGISTNEEFIVERGEVAVRYSYGGAEYQFNIYAIDSNFPSSFSETNLIGSSQVETIPWVGSNPEIISMEFDNPIIIPSNVTQILVEVKKTVKPNEPAVALSMIAGTEQDVGISWYKGCLNIGNGTGYQSTLDFGGLWPGNPNARFYITVNGYVNPILPFQIESQNNCINEEIDFTLTNQSEIDTVVWNFDDPTSTNNTSTGIEPNHQFTSPGLYNVSAQVTHIDGSLYTIIEEIEIFDAPVVNSIVELKQCDNSDIDGFSLFNLTEANEKIITNSSNYTVTYFETETLAQENNTPPITNFTAYQNQTVSTDSVWARIENNNGCYRTSQINLIVSTTQIPLTFTREFYECDDGVNTSDGIGTFDFSQVTTEIENIFPAGQQLIIKYYQSEVEALAEINPIPDADISNYQNTGSPNQQNIYIRVDSAVDNDCLGLGNHITLNVEVQPIAYPVNVNPECDNDRDGLFSFDTSNIETTILGGQTGMIVTYIDESGLALPSPLPNPFITASQTITARVTNNTSQDPDEQCYDETTIAFVVNTVPTANPIAVQEQCDTDTDGIVDFDTTSIESTILGSQTGMVVKYFDANGVALPSPLPNPFTTTSQTITVRIENPQYAICFEETTVEFLVREKPVVQVAEEAIICMTNIPSEDISVINPNANYTYTWMNANGNTIGIGETITVNQGGIYTITETSQFGCISDIAEINVIESQIATITTDDIQIIDDSSNNSITISTSNLGFGNYEFQLLDSNGNIIYTYQDSSTFSNLEGGIYTIEIRDKNGCGVVQKEVSVISYPSFITPNNDGYNDVWTIKGFNTNFYPTSTIYIYNRFGKVMAKLPPENPVWDGYYNGSQVPSNDYWFEVTLTDSNGNTRRKQGHFSLLRK